MYNSSLLKNICVPRDMTLLHYMILLFTSYAAMMSQNIIIVEILNKTLKFIKVPNFHFRARRRVINSPIILITQGFLIYSNN